MADKLSRQQQLQLQYMQRARRQALQQIVSTREQKAATMSLSPQSSGHDSISASPQPLLRSIQPQSTAMASVYDDLPIGPDDYDIIDSEDAYVSTMESACRQGALSTVQSIVSSKTPPCTRFFLHNGLTVALRAGNVEVARYLLSMGAPIIRQTPTNILSTPPDQHLSLFKLLVHHGWTVNTPGFYGAVLLPQVVANLPLLQWFLAQGADPNLGEQQDLRDRFGASDTTSCAALETAAGQGNVAAVRMLLDAGAKIQNGTPLHFAAGACPPGMNPYDIGVTSSKEFDQSRILAMALLVRRGADVNQPQESRHLVARYAIVHAVMAGAVERVKWLLEHGADPELKGAYGSAVTYAASMRSGEMRDIIDTMLRARR